MAQFILFIKGGYDADEGLSPEEIQQQIQKYRDWARSLQQSGTLIDAFKLRDDGVRVLSQRNGQIVLDGPFAETKETIGGYFVINAEDYDEAVLVAREAPILTRGGSVEIRMIES